MTAIGMQQRDLVRRWVHKALMALGGHGMKVRLLRRAGMRIGKGCRILTDHVGSEPWLVRIGDHCTVTSGVRLVTHDGACWVLRGEHPNLQDFGPIVIEDNCFIGVNAVILRGVRIGPNAIVAACSLVNRDVPPDTVVAGIPAKPIMTLDQFRSKKLADPDAQGVPTSERERRAYLEEKFRGVLDPKR